jgi:hypothetical protein
MLVYLEVQMVCPLSTPRVQLSEPLLLAMMLVCLLVQIVCLLSILSINTHVL